MVISKDLGCHAIKSVREQVTCVSAELILDQNYVFFFVGFVFIGFEWARNERLVGHSTHVVLNSSWRLCHRTTMVIAFELVSKFILPPFKLNWIVDQQLSEHILLEPKSSVLSEDFGLPANETENIIEDNWID